MKRVATFFLLAGTLVWCSCHHDVPTPTNPEISFQRDVQTIITGNCTQSGCHGLENPEKFTLLTYHDVYDNGELGGKDAEDTKLYRAITGDGEERMPQEPNDPLSDKEIQTIFLWIKQGAKNN